MADSDEEDKKEVVEILPPFKIRYNDLNMKLVKEIIKCT